MAVYHWTPDVSDYNNKHQELNYQMSRPGRSEH